MYKLDDERSMEKEEDEVVYPFNGFALDSVSRH